MRRFLQNRGWGLFFMIFLVIGCGSKNLKKAQEYIDVGMYKEASELLKIEVQENPKSTEGHYLLGLTSLFMGDETAATTSFERAILLDTQYRSKVSQGYYIVGEKNLEKGNLQQAIYFFHVAKEKDPSIGNKIAKLLFDKGNQLAQNSTNTNEPISYLKLSVEIDPTTRETVSTFCFQTAKRLIEKGFTDAAIEYAMCSVNLDTKYLKEVANLLYDVAKTYVQKAELEKFDRIVEKANQLSSDMGRIQELGSLLYDKGVDFFKQGDKHKFLLTFDRAFKLYPDYKRDEAIFSQSISEYHALKNLVLYLPFNRQDNQIATDESIHENHGRVYGAVYIPDGRSGGAYKFDGRDDFIAVDNFESLRIWDSLTVSIWFQASSFDVSDYKNPVISKHGEASGWELRVGNKKAVMMVTVNSTHYYASAKEVLQTGKWYHLVGTYDGETLKIYLNGNLSGTKAIRGIITQYESSLNIGRNNQWNDRLFSGIIDEVRIFNRVLTPDEIMSLYQMK